MGLYHPIFLVFLALALFFGGIVAAFYLKMEELLPRPFWSGFRVRFNILLSIITLIAYATTYIPPTDGWWWLGFIPFGIPGLLLLHLGVIAYWLFVNPSKALISGLTLLVGMSFVKSTFTYTFPPERPATANHFEVLSYNVHIFNVYETPNEANKQKSRAMIDWVAKHPAPIKCLQEYYHSDQSELYNTLRPIALERGYNVYVNSIENLRDKRGFFGVAIFSKYPIVRATEIPLGKKSHQKGILADVQIGADTVRIINVHLQSMSIDENQLFDAIEDEETRRAYAETAQRIRRGMGIRATQVQLLLQDYILNSPYPVVICGDFNEMPYSYAYMRLRRHLHDAFGYAGRGFGFSYNGRLSFLRIDYQFFSEGLRASTFRTRRDITYSDHFPLEATYYIP